MIYKQINLKSIYKKLKYDVYLTTYCPDNSPEVDLNRVRPTFLLLPGGGYNMVSDRENEPIALRFLGYDFNVFSLKYSVNPNTDFPYPIIEGFAALDYIRKHAREYNVDVNKIYTMGFSAGGHFAATLACYQDSEIFKKYLEIENPDFKVDGCVLGYPVISCYPEIGESGTRTNVTKSDPDKLVDFFSIDRHITEKFPKTFVFTFEEDPVVPVKNTYLLIEALKNSGVKHEMHIYHAPIHGSSLGDRSVYPDNMKIDDYKESTEWPLLAIKFLENN